MEKTIRIEFDEECKSCKGTGLYRGMAEMDGYAVVCHNCNGTGKHHFVHEYQEFTERKEKEGITTVLECNPGIIAGDGFDFGGMPYKDWKDGKPFPEKSEMRRFTCPCWWYQTADYSKKPDWKECGFGVFSGCKHFSHKELCWARWDKEFGKKV